jgi:plastocyanin
VRRLAATAAVLLAGAIAPAGASAHEPNPFETLGSAGVTGVVVSYPFERYAPDPVLVSRSLGLRYVNLDTGWHNVVALDARRPDGSAPWCKNYPADPEQPGVEQCPLFWTPLLPPGGSDPSYVTDRRSDYMVEGLQDTKVGEKYTYYCEIHPLMKVTIEVVE